MRPRQLLVPLLVPAALGLVAGCGSSTTSASATPPTPAAASATSAPSGGPQTLTLIERPTATTFTPKGGSATPGTPSKPAGPGDTSAFDAVLTRAGAPFGHDHVSFTYQAGGSALVQATLTMPDGTLTARGTAVLADSLTVPVVSGTGAYANRSGSITAKHVNQQEDDLTVALR